ncbi:MAG: AAA family ATPase [Chloroflexota bacterium]
MTGRPGAGKTTLARKLGEQLWMPVISRDALKEGFIHTLGIGHDQLPANTNGIVSDLFFETVAHYLSNGVSIIAEAAFQHQIWASKIAEISGLANVLLLICALDGKLAVERHRQRALVDSRRFFFHGDHVASKSARHSMDIPHYSEPALNVLTLHVDTTASYRPSLDKLEQLVREMS